MGNSALWSDTFETELDAVAFFHKDIANATTAADNFDQDLEFHSIKAGGQNHVAITSLYVRQTFGDLQFAGTRENPYVFLGDDPSGRGALYFDDLFLAFPTLLYLNPVLLKYALAPTVELG